MLKAELQLDFSDKSCHNNCGIFKKSCNENNSNLFNFGWGFNGRWTHGCLVLSIGQGWFMLTFYYTNYHIMIRKRFRSVILC